jgi:hypothetical protein
MSIRLMIFRMHLMRRMTLKTMILFIKSFWRAKANLSVRLPQPSFLFAWWLEICLIVWIQKHLDSTF